MTSSQITKAHSRAAALGRFRKPDDPELIQAKADVAEARLREAIRREAEADPPLNTEQRARLAVLLLRQGGGSDAAA